MYRIQYKNTVLAKAVGTIDNRPPKPAERKITLTQRPSWRRARCTRQESDSLSPVVVNLNARAAGEREFSLCSLWGSIVYDPDNLM